MPLVHATCTNCGANLTVDNTKDAAICQYCGSAYIVEKAINNYNTTNNIRANVVNIYGGNGADFVIRGGVLERYNGAATNVTIPNSVRWIGIGAFEKCYALESVTIPNSVTTIGGDAFRNCCSLKNVVLPDSITEIYDYAFAYCNSLHSITLPRNSCKLSYGVFSRCTSLTSVFIPAGTTFLESMSDSDGTFSWCSNLSAVIAEDASVNLPDAAFYETPWLQSQESQRIARGRIYMETQRRNWQKEGVCDYCGGAFKGLFSKKCTRCGKDKRY